MTPYRFYRLNHLNHFGGVEDLDAPDDATALAGAERLLKAKASPGFELWQSARRVAKRLPESRAASAEG